MLPLLPVWCACLPVGLAKGSPPEWKASVARSMDALFDKLFGGGDAWDCELALDYAARCSPGTFAEGQHRLTMVVSAGKLRLADLFAVAPDHGPAGCVARVLRQGSGGQEPDELPLSRVLCLLFAAGKRCRRCFRQLCMVIALAMDTFLLHSDLPADPLEADVIMQPRRRRDPLMAQAVAEANPGGSHRLLEAAGKAMGMLGRWAARNQRLILVKYVLACREAFSQSVVLSLALDAASVGDGSTYAGTILGRHPAAEEYVAAWCPPQVRFWGGSKPNLWKRLSPVSSGLLRFAPVLSGSLFWGPRFSPGEDPGASFEGLPGLDWGTPDSTPASGARAPLLPPPAPNLLCHTTTPRSSPLRTSTPPSAGKEGRTQQLTGSRLP